MTPTKTREELLALTEDELADLYFEHVGGRSELSPYGELILSVIDEILAPESGRALLGP